MSLKMRGFRYGVAGTTKTCYELTDFSLICRELLSEEGRTELEEWHCHQEIEILYCVSGEAVCTVDESEIILKQSCALFINSGHSHRIVQSKSVGTTTLKSLLFPAAFVFDPAGGFYRNYIAPIVKNDAYAFIHFTPDNGWQSAVAANIRSICLTGADTAVKNAVPLVTAITEIWGLLKANLASVPRLAAEKLSPAEGRLQQMVRYIQNHYQDPIALADIAGSANISLSEATRCFKKTTGTTPVNYLIQYRLEIAKEKLQSPELSVTDVAMQCGFESCSYFDRVFRKYYWITPLEYRGGNELL